MKAGLEVTMPVRPRSHVLEDESKDWFRTAMRPAWIVRDKDDDYGVDCEAERLTEGDSRTGDLFYVQLKATDNETKNRSVQINVDRLDYLLSFEVPGMVVRYCAPTGEAYWMWADEARSQADVGAASVTLNFSDHNKWTEETVGQIEQEIRLQALLKRKDYRTGFPMRIAQDVASGKRITCQTVIDRVRRAVPTVCGGMFEVPIRLSINDKNVHIFVTRGVERQVEATSNDPEDLTVAVLHSLTALLGSLQFHTQAISVGMACLSAGRAIMNDAIAGEAAVALAHNRPNDAVDLAILNRLHEEQNFGHNLLRMVLVSRFSERPDTQIAIRRFYQETISAHEKRQEKIGAIRYSFANFLRNYGTGLEALLAYNATRKDDPDYWNRPYYLRELGAILFLEKRYRASTRAYYCAVTIEPGPRVIFCYADALLYASDFSRAQVEFMKVASGSETLAAEARLKIKLAAWAEDHEIKAIGSRDAIYRLRDEHLKTVAMDQAFWPHLALTFLCESDVPCWADAIYLAMFVSDIIVVSDVIGIAQERCGMDAYAKFRSDRSEFLSRDPDLLDELDRYAAACADTEH